ncbi:MAG TPA: MBL fold metallo-hydrolase [Phycicoccus sp.]|nr:MBL fold metallo-hydrolase [Phycicoccus sp.]
MTYTGDVTPGGPSDVRELPHLTIRKMSVSEMHNNVYLLTCTSTGEQLLIDAADDPVRCLEFIAQGGESVGHLVTTHRHWDHTRALAEVATATGARTYAGAADADALPLAPDVRLEQGDTIEFGGISLDVAIVSGHTEASVVLTYRDPEGHDHVFTGDTLFPGGVGATQNDPSQSFPVLFRDVNRRIFDVHDDATWIYPGHGGDTTLGAERPHLDVWKARGW